MEGLLEQGMMLMALGMGTVFLFLSLLIAVISLFSRIIQRFESEAAPATGSTHAAHDDLHEVISAAVKQYRADHPRRK